MKNIWVPLSASVAQQRNVETIANNIANANTPGFKRDQLVFKEHLTALAQQGEIIDLPRGEWSPADFYQTRGAEHGFVKVDGSYIDFKQGALTPTSNPLDLAIKGQGFFEVLGPNGLRYTRKGIFSISKNGELVTDEGHYVLGKLDSNQLIGESADAENASKNAIPQPKERIIRIPNGRSININRQGQIFVDNRPINELSVVEFNDPHSMRKEGHSFFINSDNQNLKPTVESSIHQGFVEESNVSAIGEMSSLIKAHRNFDTIQKAMKAYDNMAGRSVNDLNRF